MLIQMKFLFTNICGGRNNFISSNIHSHRIIYIVYLYTIYYIENTKEYQQLK